MTAEVHPTSIVEDSAELGEGVRIGPYCVIGREVRIGAGCVLASHVAVAGRTVIGPRTRIYPFASIGHPPQDLKYAGEPSTLEIGADNIIREHVTMNPGTAAGGLRTVVGDGNLFMVGSHVAHDCRIADGVVVANGAQIGGHVAIGDGAVVGGVSAVHQFVRIGACAMIGGMSCVVQDVIPYGMVLGDRAALRGLNWVGLKRRGAESGTRARLRRVYGLLFDGGRRFSDGLDLVEETYRDLDEAMRIVAFARAPSDRGLCRPPGGGGG